MTRTDALGGGPAGITREWRHALDSYDEYVLYRARPMARRVLENRDGEFDWLAAGYTDALDAAALIVAVTLTEVSR